MRSLSLQNLSSFSLPTFARFPRPVRSNSEPPAVSQLQAKDQFEELASSAYAGPDYFSIDESDQVMGRSPSPTPTEIYDPEPDVVLKELESLKIKVQDFAYTPVTVGAPKPATEIFDPSKGIAEFEFRLTQKHRTYPIQGRTMRRLLTLGWVSIEEAKDRLHQMDWDALKEFDEKDKGYPWRPMKFNFIPDAEERQKLLELRFQYFTTIDSTMRRTQAEEEREERDRIAEMAVVERVHLAVKQREKMAAIEQRVRELLAEESKLHGREIRTFLSTTDKKRPLEQTASTTNLAVPDSSTGGAKRIKLTDFASSSTSSTVLYPSSSHPPHLKPPTQQYPAALQAYDPKIYPDAARIIAAEGRPPVVLPDADTPPASDDEEAENRPGVRLQRQDRGLKRKLSRTQTFKQL